MEKLTRGFHVATIAHQADVYQTDRLKFDQLKFENRHAKLGRAFWQTRCLFLTNTYYTSYCVHVQQ